MQFQKNSVVNLSSVRTGGIAIYHGKYAEEYGREKFIVSDRWPEDRVSGGTEVTFLSDCVLSVLPRTYLGGRKTTHVWDRSNPEVVYLGEGKIKTVIEEE